MNADLEYRYARMETIDAAIDPAMAPDLVPVRFDRMTIPADRHRVKGFALPCEPGEKFRRLLLMSDGMWICEVAEDGRCGRVLGAWRSFAEARSKCADRDRSGW